MSKNLNRVDRYVIFGSNIFFAWKDVVIEKYKRKCFLDHNGNHHMASMKESYSVIFTYHGGVIKSFVFQPTPAPAIVLSYYNGGTLGDMFKSVKDHGTNEYDIFSRLTIVKKNHLEQISKIQQLRSLRFFLSNRCTFAIIFIQIMADVLTIHNIFHCDLFFTNILFHFGEMDDKDEIYIRIGGWGSATISSNRRHSNHVL